jgi:hypothetical protein
VRQLVAQHFVKEALVRTRRLYTPAYAAKVAGATRQAIHKSAARRHGDRLMWVFVEPGLSIEQHSAVFVDYGWHDELEDPTEWRRWDEDEQASANHVVMEAVCRAYGWERILVDGTHTREALSPQRDPARARQLDQLVIEGTVIDVQEVPASS